MELSVERPWQPAARLSADKVILTMMDDGIRKAAILVASLDDEAAQAMLRCMGSTIASQVRAAMRTLDTVDPGEQARVVEQFVRHRPAPRVEAGPVRTGDAAAFSVPSESDWGHALGQRQATRRHPFEEYRPHGKAACEDHGDGDRRRFTILREAEDENLARLLVSERPQTIALVLAHLPPLQAGNVLARFDGRLQADVLRRLAELEETDEAILAEVEEALTSRIKDQVISRRRRVAGLSAVASILDASAGTVGPTLLGNLHKHDRSLANRLRPNRLTFDDLTQLDADTIGRILATADPRVAILALVGAPDEFIERILRRLPREEAQVVHHELNHLAPTRLRDVEEARRQMVDLAYDMAVSGKIRIPKLTTRPREPAATVEFAA